MLDIGWTEILVIAIVLIIVVGPRDLPRMLRSFGRTMTSMRKMAGEFRSQFDEALKEAELDDVRQTISDAKKLNPTRDLRDALNPLRKAGEDIKSELNKAGKGPAIAKKDPAAPAAETGQATTTAAASAAPKTSSGAVKAAPVKSAAAPTPSASTTAKGAASKPNGTGTAKAAPKTAAARRPQSAASAPAKKPAAPRKAASATKPAAAQPAAKKPAAKKKTGDA